MHTWYQTADKYDTHMHLSAYTLINATCSKSEFGRKRENKIKILEKRIAA